MVMGNPSTDAFLSACTMMGVEPEKTAMIGDGIRTDVDGAQNAGLVGIRVKTGKYLSVAAGDSGVQPNMILPSIADLKELFGK